MDDHVKLVLEAYVSNPDVFEDLIPDDWIRVSGGLMKSRG